MDGPGRCPVCGDPLVFVERYGHWFCDRCRMYVPDDQRAGIPRGWGPGREGRAGGRRGAPVGAYVPSARRGRAMVFRSVRRRGGTDTIISPVWAIIPLAPFVLLTILFIAFLWSPTGLLGLQTCCMVLFLAVILVTMMWAYILYRVLRRRQAHFDRDALLRAGLMEYIEAKAREMDVNVDVELSTMRWGDSVQRMNEPRREPVLWAVLSVLIPFVIYYTLYFLSKDAGDHHWNQDGFYRQLHSCFYKLGLPPFVPPSWQPIPSRTPVLYLILTFVFYPFMIYWLYTIIVDLNRHFEMQWEVEDNLVAAIRGR